MVDKLYQLLQRASPGPWTFETHLGCKNIVSGEEIVCTAGLSNEDADLANVELICALHNLLQDMDEATMDAWEQRMEDYDDSGTL